MKSFVTFSSLQNFLQEKLDMYLGWSKKGTLNLLDAQITAQLRDLTKRRNNIPMSRVKNQNLNWGYLFCGDILFLDNGSSITLEMLKNK